MYSRIKDRTDQFIKCAAGAEGMVGGQVLRYDGEATSLNLDELEKVHVNKTGALVTL